MDMAKRKYSKMTKIEPSVQTFQFSVTQENVNDINFIDLSQCASLLNRRFYRQGINWAVSSIKILTSATGAIGVNKLPNTWVMSNAWEKGFRAWQKMNNEALAESPSVKPKFLDFKIYMDETHHSKGFDRNLLPQSFGIPNPIDAIAGEWFSSKYEVPQAVAFNSQDVSSREIIGVGPSYPGVSPVTGLDAVSLIEGYAASRGLPNIEDPNTPKDAADADGLNPSNWLTALFNDGSIRDAEVIDLMTSENNQAPYPFENGADPLNPGFTFPDTMYPGGANQLASLEIHDTEFVTSSTIGGTTRLKGGNFPCGLMQLTSSFAAGTEFIVQLSMVPGTHRGYLCESMTEM